jgi:hypothetical protein
MERKSYTQGHQALFCFTLIVLLLATAYFIYGRYQTYQRLESYVSAERKDYTYVAAMLSCLKKKSIFLPMPVGNCIESLSANATELVRYRIETSFDLASRNQDN